MEVQKISEIPISSHTGLYITIPNWKEFVERCYASDSGKITEVVIEIDGEKKEMTIAEFMLKLDF